MQDLCTIPLILFIILGAVAGLFAFLWHRSKAQVDEYKPKAEAYDQIEGIKPR